MVSCAIKSIEYDILTVSIDVYLPSQLILISVDLVAHYWEAMGHVSYFRRVDIDSLIQT